jgi:hypothetical protein
MVTSLLDRHGLRHEIDLETWVSKCVQWVVTDEAAGKGLAVLHIETTTYTQVNTLGSAQAHWVAGRGVEKGEVRPFEESSEPITCFACIAKEGYG